jgi:small subunit ribosomal protein S7
MMKDGKKVRARKHVSLLLSTLRLHSSALPMDQLREAIRLAAPNVRLTQQKKGGKQVAVPIALGERQKVHKAIVWIIEASDKRKKVSTGGSKAFGERVALEIEAVLQGTSDVLKKKEQLHATATVSRANVNVGSRR